MVFYCIHNPYITKWNIVNSQIMKRVYYFIKRYIILVYNVDVKWIKSKKNCHNLAIEKKINFLQHIFKNIYKYIFLCKFEKVSIKMLCFAFRPITLTLRLNWDMLQQKNSLASESWLVMLSRAVSRSEELPL